MWRFLVAPRCFPGNLPDKIATPKPGNNGIQKEIHRIRLCGAFPDRQDSPPVSFQLLNLCDIASMVTKKLGRPEFTPCAGNTKIPAPFVRVPETAMDENDRPEPRQHDIRPPRKTTDMKPVSQPPRVEATPDQHLRLGIFAPDPCHHLGSGHRCPPFSHGAFSWDAARPRC